MTAVDATAVGTVLARIPDASAVVDAHLNRTEVRTFGWLSPYAGRDVYAKLETQQVTGSFKPRGALYALSCLDTRTHVVAPSAGNHGLAVAWAAARLGLKANVVLPQNASPLKRERILGLGAGVIEHGLTVDDAADEARRLAQRPHWHYISPFNDTRIVAGQATAVIELLEERPDLQSLVVPVGGGGLLAGAIAARDYLGRRLQIVACEPEEFRSMMHSIRIGRVARVARRATFADGLALNLEPGSITLDIALAANDLVQCALTEEEIAAACTAVFNREAILTEGAAAVGVAATLHADRLGLPEGPVGVMLCGGNVHHTTFWQMVTHPFTDARLTELADTLGRSVEAEPRRRQVVDPDQPVVPAPEAVTDRDVDEAGLPAAVVANLTAYTARTRLMLDDYAGLARGLDLPLDLPLLDLVKEINDRVSAGASAPEPAQPQRREQRFRALSQLAVASRMSFEWRSPAYDQSATLAQFDPGALGSPGINYARYDQPGTAELEQQLADLVGVSPETHAVLTTSSGMAAFTLAAATAAAQRPIRSVLTAPYLYFESMETLRYLLREQVSVATTYQAELLADLAWVQAADAVFADPLANHPEQRMIDVVRLAELLAAREQPPWLIVDASMLPVVTARPVSQAMPEHAIYYESCSKYLQFGLDVAMAGMVVVPRAIEPLARRMRRNLGLGLDRYGAELFPRYRPEHFARRTAVVERAALLVATQLDRVLPGNNFAVAFPGIASHPDHDLAERLGRSGSCVTLAPVARQLNRDQLDPIVDAAMREAKRRRLPLVKGVSFGFSTSRLSAAAAMAEAAPPFLRLSVGVLDSASAIELADVVRQAIAEVTALW